MTSEQEKWLKDEINTLRKETENVDDSIAYMPDLVIQFCDHFAIDFSDQGFEDLDKKIEKLIREAWKS